MIRLILKFISLLYCFCFLSLAVVSADSPYVFRGVDGKCLSSVELCGDGIDQDCDGVDLSCAGEDGDRDGFIASADCDDSDRKVYPGIYSSCQVNAVAGTRLCQSDGTFSACSVTPLCEAVGSGKCYYVSALSGSDSNPGSFQLPWKSFRRITSYYRDADYSGARVILNPGDVVYFMSGVYRDVYQYDRGFSGFSLRSFVLGSEAEPLKIKAYPGANVVFAPSQHVPGIYIFNSKGIIIEGIEVSGAYQTGVRIDDSAGPIEIRNVWVHDTDGEDNSNIAGIYTVRSTRVNIHHSLIHDNYDRTCVDTAGVKTINSRNMVFFEGGNIRVHHNTVFQTPDTTAQKTGSCIVYKHGQTLVGGIFEVDHNTFKNCWSTTIGNSGYGGRFHHNLIVDSAGISVDGQGTIHTSLSDNLIEFNTFIDSNSVDFRPSQAVTAGLPFGSLVFRRNIVVRHGAYAPEVEGVLWVDPYGSDSLFTSTKSAFQSNENCFYTQSVETKFGYFAYSSNSSSVQGASYPFAAWKAQLGYDTGSTVADPRLDARGLPGLASCLNKGIYAEDGR